MAVRERATKPVAIPASLAPLVADRAWFRDTVGEAGAAVYRLPRAGCPDLYLKHGRGDVGDAVVDEMVRMRWLGAHVAVPRVEGFVIDEADA